MNIQEIIDLWSEDSKIDVNNLAQQAADVAFLHNKYYKIYLQERARYRSLEAQAKVLYKQKFEYYTGTIDEETLRERQWKPFALRVLKNEVPMHLDADKDVQEHKEKLERQKDKVEYIENIIKTINNRNFSIKNVIDWMKWSQGSL